MARTSFDMITGSPLAPSTPTINVLSGWIAMVVLISNGTDTATLTLRDGSVTGRILWQRSTIGTVENAIPMKLYNKAANLYVDLSGTGAVAQIYEAVHSNNP